MSVDQKWLVAAAQRASESLNSLINNSDDPGIEALGAQYELDHALDRLSPDQKPLDKPGFSLHPDTIREAALLSMADDLWVACPHHLDTGDQAMMGCQCPAVEEIQRKAKEIREGQHSTEDPREKLMRAMTQSVLQLNAEYASVLQSGLGEGRLKEDLSAYRAFMTALAAELYGRPDACSLSAIRTYYEALPDHLRPDKRAEETEAGNAS